MNIDRAKLVEQLRKGISALQNWLQELMSEKESIAYSEGINIGIDMTISTLYEAGVKDKVIIDLLNKYWGIPRGEADSRLLFEKSQAPCREVKHFLELQGYSVDEISAFARKNFPIIRHECRLWDLRNDPEKLLKELEKLNGSK